MKGNLDTEGILKALGEIRKELTHVFFRFALIVSIGFGIAILLGIPLP